VKKRIPPKKHHSFCKSLSDDEIVKGTVVKKKIPPKRHPPRSLSDDESLSSKKSQFSKNSAFSKGPAARNQSGMKGPGISASKSMPFVAKKNPLNVADYASESSDESDMESEESDMESETISRTGRQASALRKKSGGPVVKKKSLSDDEVSSKARPKQRAPFSNDENRSVRSNKSQFTQKSNISRGTNPTTRSGMNGRDVGAITSMPMGANRAPVRKITLKKKSENPDDDEISVVSSLAMSLQSKKQTRKAGTNRNSSMPASENGKKVDKIRNYMKDNSVKPTDLSANSERDDSESLPSSPKLVRRSKSLEFGRKPPLKRAISSEFGKFGKMKTLPRKVLSEYEKKLLAEDEKKEDKMGHTKPAETKAITVRDVQRGQLKKTLSNERRSTIKDHLNLFLDDDSVVSIPISKKKS
jgi:hypothetical protein